MGHPGPWWELGCPLGDLTLFLHHLSKANVMEREIVTLTFKSLDEIRKCCHSNKFKQETSSVVLSNGTIYLVCRSNF